jgi:holo-[acyl-carrier protein] synthase
MANHGKGLQYHRYMIYGIGIDIVKIERMKAVVEKWGQRFLRKVFTDREITYCFRKKIPYLSLAVRFAAKEALIKAIGSEVPVSFNDIEVSNAATGKPFLKLGGKVGDFLDANGIRTAHLTLSHEHDYGIACVILEK